MKVISFDLSSVCIGVFVCELDDNLNILSKSSCSIIPKKFNPESIGYLPNKKSIITKSGKKINCYLKPGETSISSTEKKSRDSKVRSQKDIFIIEQIGKNISDIIESVSPDLILVEKNAIFNGILTSILLAKIMGVLVGLSGAKQIPIQEYSVREVRSIYNTKELFDKMSKIITKEEIKSLPDVTKRALRFELEKQYNTTFLTDDESDACAVFNYWHTKNSPRKG